MVAAGVMMLNLTGQLDLLGVEETKRRVAAEGATPAERKRLSRRLEVTHEMMSELPTAEDLSFLHSGLCQTCLPHSPTSHLAPAFRALFSPGPTRRNR